MDVLFRCLLLFVVVWSSGADDKHEPMVAFLCNRPSMYLTDHGWMKDDNTGCLRDPIDILNYCRKVFPNLDVRNVVESSDKVTIENWCGFGHSSCQRQFTVRPFRCLVGPFQSDALLVPEHCVFDHVHDAKKCTSFDEWSKTATRSCFGRNMEMQSLSMLQPCGIDKFSGVEFVCCPIAKDSRPTTVVPTTVAVPTEPPKPVRNDPLSAYVNRIGGAGRGWNEHEYFVKATEDMHRNHQEKMSKVMKEWATAREHVLELKARDPKAAEKLNKEITIRFQKTYEALEVESALEKKQLSSLHQQRVQAELNNKQRHALDEYMRSISDNNDPSEILRTLKHFIKVIQKDRLHTVNRYRHLRDTDPAEAEALRLDMADHLRTIDQQLAVAIAMLDRVPKYKKKIQLQIDDYLVSYHTIDTSVAVLMRSLEDNPPSTTTTTTTTQKPFNHDDYIDDEGDKKEEEDDDDDEDDYTDDESDDGDDDNSDDEQKDYRVVEAKPVEYESEEEDGDVDDDVDDDSMDEDDEDEEIKVDRKKKQEEEVEKADSKKAPETAKDTSDEDDDSYEDEDTDDDIPVAPATTSPAIRPSAALAHGEYRRPVGAEHDIDDVADFSDGGNQHEPQPFVANADKSYLSVKEPYIKKASTKGVNGFGAAVPVGIVIGSITVLATVIVASVIIVRHRRSNRRSRSSAVNVRLDPSASPEERHIAAMQMSGYENPTYKYFESVGGTANA